MRECDSMQPEPTSCGQDLHADEKYMVRNRRQIRQLLHTLIEQRAFLNACPNGRRAQSFPSAVLDVDEDSVLLDGSAQPEVNRNAAEADYLLCCAQVDKVTLRFRVEHARVRTENGHTALHAALPEEIFHLQRRQLYRLHTPLIDSPWCLFPMPQTGQTPRWRVVDISAGGIALLLPPDQTLLELRQRCTGCQLQLPDTAPIPVTLAVCSKFARKQLNDVEQQRVGLCFEDLPRGADAAIQRYIFRIDRERKAKGL